MEKFFDEIYSKAYKKYRFMPVIVASIVEFLFFVWGIIDAITGITDFNDIIDDAEIVAVFLWLIIGAIVALICFAISVIAISPTVVRTDAVLEIASNAKNGTTEIASAVDTNELPEI